MAKANPGGGKDYGSNEPGDAYDRQTAEDAPKDPEAEAPSQADRACDR